MGLSNRITPRHPQDGSCHSSLASGLPSKVTGSSLNPLPPIGDLVGLTTFLFSFFFFIYFLCGQYAFQHVIILD